MPSYKSVAMIKVTKFIYIYTYTNADEQYVRLRSSFYTFQASHHHTLQRRHMSFVRQFVQQIVKKKQKLCITSLTKGWQCG